MAIPYPPNQQTCYLQQGNKQVLISWNIVPGTTSYNVQRSTDGVNFATIATPSTTQYLDTAVTLNTEYWYQVASVNGSGTSSYTQTTPASIIPVVAGYIEFAAIKNLSSAKSGQNKLKLCDFA
jgi:titin